MTSYNERVVVEGGAKGYETMTMIMIMTYAKHEICSEPNGLLQILPKP